jgi:hypothetical protein
MPTNFPTSLDSLTNPSAGDSQQTVSHSSQHANINDAMEAVQAKVGVDGSAVTTSHDYKLGDVTSTAKAVPSTRQVIAGTGLTGGGTLAADRTLAVAYGSSASTACEGNDSRLSDSRAPTAHATSHQSGGSDAIKLDDCATPDDNTDLDATTGRHGLLPKLGGGTTNFLRADGAWATPAGGGDVSDGDTLTTGLTFPLAGLHILDTNASHDLIISPGSDLTVDRTLTLTTGDADRTLTISGSTTLGGGSHSGTNTGDQNTFGTIAVSGQSDVVADAANDTLTLAAGSNITITTDATTDTITIAASGGGGTPGGSDTQVQYNNAGAFGGSASFIWNETGKYIKVSGGAGPTPALSAGDGVITTNTTTGLTFGGRGTTYDIAFYNRSWSVVFSIAPGTTVVDFKGTAIYVPEGSAASPGVTFDSDRDTGLYRIGADQLGVSVGGALRATWSTSALTLTVPLIAPAATTSIPSARLPHGTAPTSPTNGDVWTTTAGIYVRVNGTTIGPLAAQSGTGAPCEIGIAVGDESSVLTTGTAKVTFRMPYAMTLTGVRGSLTATGTGTTVDINESGVSVLSTKLTFDSGEKTTTTAATPAVISDSALADDAEITIDIDATSGNAAGLKIWLIGTRA